MTLRLRKRIYQQRVQTDGLAFSACFSEMKPKTKGRKNEWIALGKLFSASFLEIRPKTERRCRTRKEKLWLTRAKRHLGRRPSPSFSQAVTSN
ncbi:hypothetical protein [Rufibacter sp. XAAS-G3-1]|uniref:hypothetical protein n=1 Tax=Rufibacter sp. XAAS-G3-1 TaxID=2729134 RepID=UPI0015E712D8|nr:hypothetical protein [Rufibacter sp. XAAS-G3-1]